MVNCPLQDTSKDTVNMTLYIESKLPIRFNFTVCTKTCITSPFLVIDIYFIKHAYYHSRCAFLSLKYVRYCLDTTLQMRVCAGMLTCVCEHMLPSQVAKCNRVSDTVHACHPWRATYHIYASDISGLAHFNHFDAKSCN